MPFDLTREMPEDDDLLGEIGRNRRWLVDARRNWETGIGMPRCPRELIADMATTGKAVIGMAWVIDWAVARMIDAGPTPDGIGAAGQGITRMATVAAAGKGVIGPAFKWADRDDHV